MGLDALALQRTRETLANLEGYRGEFSDVSVSVLHLSYSVHGLKIVPEPRGGTGAQLSFGAKRLEIALVASELVRRRARVLRVELDDPKLEVAGLGGNVGKKRWDAEIQDRIARMSPRIYQRIEVKRGEVTFTDERNGAPAVRLHNLDLALENLATRVEWSNGEPTTLAARGTVQRTGQLSVFVTAHPFAKRLTFAGRAAVRGLDVRDLADLLVKKAELAPEKGTIDVFARFVAREGRLTGGVKPVLKGVEVKPARPGRPQLKAWLTDAALRIFSDRVPGREAATGVVPIHGDLTNPNAELWTTVWGVLRNAFVAGIESGFTDLPPSTGQKQGAPPRARAAPSKRGQR